MSFTPLPDSPSRGDPVNFNARADAFFPALERFVEEANSLIPGETAAGLAQFLATTGAGRGASLIAYEYYTVDDKLRERRSLLEGLTPSLRSAIATGVYTPQLRDELLAALTTAWNSALAGGYDLHAPTGRYEIGDANFHWRNTGAGILDCKGITLYGDGPSTVFATYSPDGADVFQLNALKNFHIRNLRITATLTARNNSGSNGISVTGGWDNITVSGVTVDNLPFTNRVSGAGQPFVDGGKALSLQPGTTGNPCGMLRASIVARGCAEAFGLDAPLSTMAAKSAAIDLVIEAEDCFRAFKISMEEPTGAVTNAASLGITARVKSINCQQDVLLSRAVGVRLEAQISTNKTAAARRVSPGGFAWEASDTVVEALRCAYAKGSHIRINGNKGACDYKARIGGTTNGSGGLNGMTEDCDIKLDIGGTASIGDVVEINAFNLTMRASALTVSSRTATALPSVFYTTSLDNTLRVGNNTGTYTGTLTGCTTSPTGTVRWSLNGDVVTLEVPGLTGTSNGTTASITGMPTWLAPGSIQNCMGVAIDNGVSKISRVQVIPVSGAITLNNALTSFTATGTKGCEPFTISFRRSG